MCGVIDSNGVQWERCNACLSWVRFEDLCPTCDDAPRTEYEVTYIGTGGFERRQLHVGNASSVAKLVTYLEERGAQMVTVEELGPVDEC